MKNLLFLFIYFRSNKHIFLADICKAFLMIKMNIEEDKNRFCFFMKTGDQLVRFRYITLILGFVASPFILNFLIQFLLKSYPNNKYAKILHTRFYVDNLIFTSNSPDSLLKNYYDSVNIMGEGNFHVRSCKSNSDKLRKQMISDGTIVEHDNGLEKMIGYYYDDIKDVWKLNDKIVDPSANTKRKILAQTAGMFDQLSLCLHVTVTGKLLLRDSWKMNFGWDDIEPADKVKDWKNLASELTMLKEFEFP